MQTQHARTQDAHPFHASLVDHKRTTVGGPRPKPLWVHGRVVLQERARAEGTSTHVSIHVHPVSMPPQMVTIEGNIGSGKTTIAKHIANYMPDTEFFTAPSRTSNPHYPGYLKSPKDHAFAMQCWFLRSRLRIYVSALEHMERTQESVILDFSIWSDIIFATSHRNSGTMTQAEYEEYLALYDQIIKLALPPPHLSIILEASPRICRQRSEQARAAKGLPPLDEEYLDQLHELFRQRWLRECVLTACTS